MSMPDFVPEGGQRDSAGDGGFLDFVPQPQPVYSPIVEEVVEKEVVVEESKNTFVTGKKK